MAYYSLHAYDADVWIPQFSGLMQANEIASDLRYAMEAENVETFRGVLQPMAAPVIASSSKPSPLLGEAVMMREVSSMPARAASTLA